MKYKKARINRVKEIKSVTHEKVTDKARIKVIKSVSKAKFARAPNV